LIHGAHQKSLTLVLENWWSHGMPWPSAEVSWGRRAPKSIGFLLKTSKNRSFWMILGSTICKNTPEKDNCNGPLGDSTPICRCKLQAAQRRIQELEAQAGCLGNRDGFTSNITINIYCNSLHIYIQYINK
jgi:hypothetical protein